MKFLAAPDIKRRVILIVKKLGLNYVLVNRLICFRSTGSKSKARARIWSFPRVWQLALKIQPHYVIEIISEKFDQMSKTDQDKILIHELLHIPQNFSGALLSHRRRGRIIDMRMVNKLYEKLKLPGLRALGFFVLLHLERKSSEANFFRFIRGFINFGIREGGLND